LLKESCPKGAEQALSLSPKLGQKGPTLDELKKLLLEAKTPNLPAESGTVDLESLKKDVSLEELKKDFLGDEAKDPDLKSLQEMFGLKAEDLPGPSSLKDLQEMFGVRPAEEYAQKLLREGLVLRGGPKDSETESFVKKVQTLLKEKGYALPEHGADGIFGKETSKAILAFQEANSKFALKPTGEIDGSTWIILRDKIGVDAPKAASAPNTEMESGSAEEGGDSDPIVAGNIAGRSQLKSISDKTKDRLFRLTQAEVGVSGELAQQAFMETVSNRSFIQGRTIDYTVTDKRYYEPIMGPGKSTDALPPVSEATRAKYEKILRKVIEGSNVSNGATHNASGSVAENWKTKYDGHTMIDIGKGKWKERFYSKTYEQKKLKKLKLDGAADEANAPSPVSGIPSSRPTSTGEHRLPKLSFVSVPCKNAAQLAIKESREAWDNGNIVESDPRAEKPILKYYEYTSKNNSYKRNIDRWGTGIRSDEKNKGKRQLNPIKRTEVINGKTVAVDWYHWSAVYISWVMGQFDGEGAKWFVHEGHGGYVRAYQGQRAVVERNPEDHKGKMYYLWFSREEMLKYGLKPEPGDVIGRTKHCDIYIGNGMMIGGNTRAKNEHTGNKYVNGKGTSGAQPVRWMAGSGVIKRVKITGSGTENLPVA
jgi:peptidoglycan hydrolase-like protein with peptidoglycan-binding domain